MFTKKFIAVLLFVSSNNFCSQNENKSNKNVQSAQDKLNKSKISDIKQKPKRSKFSNHTFKNGFRLMLNQRNLRRIIFRR